MLRLSLTHSSFLTRAVALGAGLGVVVGCAAPVDGSSELSEETSASTTRALVSVERQTTIEAGSTELGSTVRASALARFIRIDESTNPDAVLDLVGATLELPEVGRCELRGPEADPSFTTIGEVEFLAVGDVTLGTGDEEAELAPRAFPTLTDAISGVVYTTRDQQEEALPGGVRYTVTTTGSEALAPVEATALAPAELEGVLLDGQPLVDVDGLERADELELEWTGGTRTDRVYLVATTSPDSALICTYDDAGGRGLLPMGQLGDGPVRIELHRLRSVAFQSPSEVAGELRFDFSISADIELN